MNILQALVAYFKRNPLLISNNNGCERLSRTQIIISNVGWVQAYAYKHLNGIALTRIGNGNDLHCPKCKTSFQKTTL